MKTPDRETLRAQLDEERARLLELMDDVAAGTPADSWTGTLGRTGDVVDAATNRAARTDADTVLKATRQRLDRIEDALSRLDDGSYGTCDACGGAIEAERLEVLPFTTLCVEDVRTASRSA